MELNKGKNSEVFEELTKKERGFNKYDSLVVSEMVTRTNTMSGMESFLNLKLLNDVVIIKNNNTFLMPSEIEFFGLESESEIKLGDSVLGLYNYSDEDNRFYFEETNVAKYVVTSDRFYNNDDYHFISSDWATPIKLCANYEDLYLDEYINVGYFKNNDKTIKDYIKERFNGELVVWNIKFSKHGEVLINLMR